MTIEIYISYFIGETCVEYTVEGYASNIKEAQEIADDMVQIEMNVAYNNGVMMETFYYEVDFTSTEEMAEAA